MKCHGYLSNSLFIEYFIELTDFFQENSLTIQNAGGYYLKGE